MGDGSGKVVYGIASQVKKWPQGDVPGKQAGVVHATNVVVVPVSPESNPVTYTA